MGAGAPAQQIAQERKQAELDVPKLVDVLELKPGNSFAMSTGAGSLWIPSFDENAVYRITPDEIGTDLTSLFRGAVRPVIEDISVVRRS